MGAGRITIGNIAKVAAAPTLTPNTPTTGFLEGTIATAPPTSMNPPALVAPATTAAIPATEDHPQTANPAQVPLSKGTPQVAVAHATLVIIPQAPNSAMPATIPVLAAPVAAPLPAPPAIQVGIDIKAEVGVSPKHITMKLEPMCVQPAIIPVVLVQDLLPIIA